MTRHPGEDPSGDTIELVSILRFIRRRLGVIIGVCLLVTGIVAMAVSRMTPQYTATAVVMLDTRKTTVADVEAVLSGIPAENAALRSELDIIRSRTLIRRVADRLDLYDHPLINPPQQPGFLEKLTGWTIVAIEWLSIEDVFGAQAAAAVRSLQSPPDPRDPVAERRRVIDRLIAGLAAENDGRSYTLHLSFTSPDPELSTRIVNTVADQYLVDQLDAKFEATRRANQWLAERLAELRQEVREAETAVRSYRERHDLIQSRGTTVTEQQLAELNAQLVVARVARSQAEARLAGARAGSPEGLADVQASPVIQRLRSEESSLRQRETELSGRYGPLHPEMVNIRAEREDIQNKLREEMRRVIQALENEVAVAVAKEEALQEALSDLRSATGGLQLAEVELNELQRQADSARALYENFLTRFRETSDQQELERPDSRVIAEADVPNQPSFPRARMMIGLGGLVGLLFGILAATLIELLDRGFRGSEQLERQTGLPVLGIVPSLRRRDVPGDYVVAKPVSAFSEALRRVRSALQFANIDQSMKLIMVTSSIPGEGKTSLTISMGRLAALSGARTLIIEADMRRPCMASILGVEPAGYLADVVAGTCDIATALVRDEHSGAHFLLSDNQMASPAEMLASRRMAGLLRATRDAYDLVIVDTPPVMVVSDAAGLAKSVDGVVFAVRWAETSRDTVKAGLRQLDLLDVKVTGLVLSRVNMRKQAAYGYGDYAGRYKEYYVQ